MKTASEENKPCPFCSAKVEYVGLDHDTANVYWFVDHFSECWLRGRMFIMDLEQLECWNKRD